VVAGHVGSLSSDNSQNAEHCAEKYHIALSTTDPEDIFKHPDIDVIFNLTSDEFHEYYTIAALKAGKHVMLEKPITLSLPSVERIIEAEQQALNNARVFVGYMRRYAKSFTQTFKREVATIPRILYARSRDFSGPNAKFVSESGTFQVNNTDFSVRAAVERQERLDALFGEAFPGQTVTPEMEQYCRFLGGLGSHDISLMREILGFPDAVAGVSVNHPFYSAIFDYKDKAGHPFAVTYESGIDGVPDFDAHLAVYGEKKRVMIKYDSPYVKGLPIKVTVQELNEAEEMETREMLGSYEDAYTTELQEMYECFVNGKEIKTSAKDAMEELRLYDMMYRKWKG
jgi:predicted dehydrogenase